MHITKAMFAMHRQTNPGLWIVQLRLFYQSRFLRRVLSQSEWTSHAGNCYAISHRAYSQNTKHLRTSQSHTSAVSSAFPIFHHSHIVDLIYVVIKLPPHPSSSPLSGIPPENPPRLKKASFVICWCSIVFFGIRLSHFFPYQTRQVVYIFRLSGRLGAARQLCFVSNIHLQNKRPAPW